VEEAEGLSSPDTIHGPDNQGLADSASADWLAACSTVIPRLTEKHCHAGPAVVVLFSEGRTANSGGSARSLHCRVVAAVRGGRRRHFLFSPNGQRAWVGDQRATRADDRESAAGREPSLRCPGAASYDANQPKRELGDERRRTIEDPPARD
jgi:hypothetical protein